MTDSDWVWYDWPPDCVVQGCTGIPAFDVDGDTLCEAHYQEHWAGK